MLKAAQIRNRLSHDAYTTIVMLNVDHVVLELHWGDNELGNIRSRIQVHSEIIGLSFYFYAIK